MRWNCDPQHDMHIILSNRNINFIREEKLCSFNMYLTIFALIAISVISTMVGLFGIFAGGHFWHLQCSPTLTIITLSPTLVLASAAAIPYWPLNYFNTMAEKSMKKSRKGTWANAHEVDSPTPFSYSSPSNLPASKTQERIGSTMNQPISSSLPTQILQGFPES